jgi:quercetin dioxygenase-like cupin family protein/uncharacterized protein (DUF2249 family)
MNEKPLIESGAAKVLSLAEETKFAANGIVSRTLLRTENSRAVLFGFAEGQELTEHTSTQHALIQILSGECEFSLGDKPHMLKAGDFLYMPPNLPHAVKATKQFSMLLTLAKPVAAEKLNFLTETKTSIPNMKEQIEPNKILDGRGMPCAVKHPLIIQRWQELSVGDYFVLQNDHDPVGLFEQFSAKWPGAFAWQHLARDPEDFRVKITKLKIVAREVVPQPDCACQH